MQLSLPQLFRFLFFFFLGSYGKRDNCIHFFSIIVSSLTSDNSYPSQSPFLNMAMRATRSWHKADFFRHIPRDLTEATAIGAIISILCMAIMAILFIGEVVSYVSPRIQSDMVMAQRLDSSETIKASLDMTFHKLPCAVLSLDILDVLHNHVMNSMENLKKERLDTQGIPIKDGRLATDFVNSNEGCHISGYITLSKVPGNFHISSHGNTLATEANFPGGINVEHTINHLSFGSTDVRKLEKSALLHPLDGRAFRDDTSKFYQYVIDVVPTTYEGVFSSANTYQFTANMNSFPAPPHSMPAVIFKYQLSPIAVQYSKARVSFTHFLTYVCAIIGGVYTVAGLLSRVIYSSSAQIQRRLLGKGD